MPAWLERLRPDSSVATRILLSAWIWTLVGAGLTIAGLRWLAQTGGGVAWFALAVALGLGALKARFVLADRASANARRIAERGEPRCVGGVFSWKSWLLVAGMMGLGFALRRSALPRFWLGLIYTAVGSALLGASWVAWSAWRKRR